MCVCVCEKIKGTDSHVVQDTPAAVGITGAEALSTCAVLLAGLHGDLDHLKPDGRHNTVKSMIKIYHKVWPNGEVTLFLLTI